MRVRRREQPAGAQGHDGAAGGQVRAAVPAAVVRHRRARPGAFGGQLDAAGTTRARARIPKAHGTRTGRSRRLARNWRWRLCRWTARCACTPRAQSACRGRPPQSRSWRPCGPTWRSGGAASTRSSPRWRRYVACASGRRGHPLAHARCVRSRPGVRRDPQAIQDEFVQSRKQAAAAGAPPGSLKTQDDLYRELALARYGGVATVARGCLSCTEIGGARKEAAVASQADRPELWRARPHARAVAAHARAGEPAPGARAAHAGRPLSRIAPYCHIAVVVHSARERGDGCTV